MDDRTDAAARVVVGPAPPKGRGVFATRSIRRDEVVESAPVIVIPVDEQKKIHATLLNDYVFGWGDTIAVVLGYGSLYNHSWESNLEYRKRLDDGSSTSSPCATSPRARS